MIVNNEITAAKSSLRHLLHKKKLYKKNLVNHQ